MSKTASSRSSSAIFIIGGIIWAVFSLMFFLLGSTPGPDGEKSALFLLGITFLETGAFFISSLLCLRNWQSTQIVSGRNVWLWIGLGLLSYTVGNVLFFLWGNVWGLDPAVSLGDLFYIMSYIFLAAGMFKAVLPRRLNLEPPQWLIVAGIGMGSVLLAYFVNYQVAEATAIAPPPSVEIAQATAQPETTDIAPADGAETAPEVPADSPESGTFAPSWVAQLDSKLEPFASVVGLLYVIGDCVLMIIAGTLLVAFWGGRFSQSWKLIAFAAFCLYIADMFFAYTVNRGNYVEGSLWEVFWTFSAVFFGLGAVVEHDVSTKSRRSPRRRRG